MQSLSNSELIQIVNGPLRIENPLFLSAMAELLERIKEGRQSNKVDSIFDVQAIQEEAQRVTGILEDVKRKVTNWSDDDIINFAEYVMKTQYIGFTLGELLIEFKKQFPGGKNH